MNAHEFVQSSEDRKPGFSYGYVIVFTSFLLLLIIFGTQYSFGVFFKPVLEEFGWTRSETSAAYSLYQILVGVFSIVTGRLSDRFGPRVVVTVSCFLMCLGYALMSRITALWHMYLVYGVMISIGGAGAFVPLLSTVARWFDKRRGLACGIAASGVGVGTIIMPPLATGLIATYDWRNSYVIFGVAALVVTVAIAQFLKRDPGQIRQSSPETEAIKTGDTPLIIHGLSLRESIKTRQFWIICSIIFCVNTCVHAVMVHIVPHATDIGISPVAAATILSVIGLVGIGSRIGAGSAGDKTGNKRVLILICVLLLAAFLWLRVSGELWMLYLFAFIFALGYGSNVAVQSPLLAEYFGMKAHGAIFGFYNFFSCLGAAIGSIAAGRIFDITGSYNWAFTLFTILSAASLILTLCLKHVKTKTG